MDRATRLLHAARDGDPRAFGDLVHLTRGDVARYCAYLADPRDVEDLVQETYLGALRGLRHYRGDAPALRWLLTIARRVCADEIQRRERFRRPELTRRPAHDESATLDLEVLIADLPMDQRQAFVLTQVFGYRYEDAAEVCGCPTGTIRSRVARARRQLAAILRPAPSSP